MQLTETKKGLDVGMTRGARHGMVVRRGGWRAECPRMGGAIWIPGARAGSAMCGSLRVWS